MREQSPIATLPKVMPMNSADVPKLSKRDHAILVQLDRGDAFGLDLVCARVVSRSGVYVALGLLEDRGFVHRDKEHDAISELPRHRFSITERGRAALADNPSVPVAQVNTSLWRRLVEWLKKADAG